MTDAREKPPNPSGPASEAHIKKHKDELLDEALEETFPASDPPAMLQQAADLPLTPEDEAHRQAATSEQLATPRSLPAPAACIP